MAIPLFFLWERWCWVLFHAIVLKHLLWELIMIINNVYCKHSSWESGTQEQLCWVAVAQSWTLEDPLSRWLTCMVVGRSRSSAGCWPEGLVALHVDLSLGLLMSWQLASPKRVIQEWKWPRPKRGSAFRITLFGECLYSSIIYAVFY